MTRRTIAHLHRGLLGGMVVGVLALLATFYSVVAGAVDLAASKQLQAAGPSLRSVAADTVKRTVPGRQPALLAVAAP
ncbi:MAG: hypothetical protein ABIO71_09550 [Caldimonas sp.]